MKHKLLPTPSPTPPFFHTAFLFVNHVLYALFDGDGNCCNGAERPQAIPPGSFNWAFHSSFVVRFLKLVPFRCCL